MRTKCIPLFLSFWLLMAVVLLLRAVLPPVQWWFIPPLPSMPEAVDRWVSYQGPWDRRIVFDVDASVDDIVQFYRTVLPTYGWAYARSVPPADLASDLAAADLYFRATETEPCGCIVRVKIFVDAMMSPDGHRMVLIEEQRYTGPFADPSQDEVP